MSIDHIYNDSQSIVNVYMSVDFCTTIPFWDTDSVLKLITLFFQHKIYLRITDLHGHLKEKIPIDHIIQIVLHFIFVM